MPPFDIGTGRPVIEDSFLPLSGDYVLATQAFLRRDRAQLLAARECIASSSPVQGEIPNLKVVDSLITHFGAAYTIAYKAHR